MPATPHLRLAALGLALMLGACASPPPAAVPPASANLFEDQAFGAPSMAPDVSAVFALSPAMRAYLDADIGRLIHTLGPQRGLVEAIHTKAQLRLEYDAERTRTAAEAFDARTGNCLSLVVLVAAFAKQLDLPITYQALIGQETWSRSGGYYFVNGHVNITVARRLIDQFAQIDGSERLRISFGTIPRGRGQLVQSVGEATIVAMFMNNRAAELLVQSRIDDAYAHVREAIRQDPGYVAAYNTLGVIYQRKAMRVAAERAFRAALERDENHRAALYNVARLLDQQGYRGAAAYFEARLAKLERDPPFAHFDRGVAAAEAGDYATARDELLLEMKRDPDYHEFHFWLAVALHGLGDVERARQHLELARKYSVTQRDQAVYGAKLRRIEAAAAVARRPL
jgi:Tfp pilus assembly protein PilF